MDEAHSVFTPKPSLLAICRYMYNILESYVRSNTHHNTPLRLSSGITIIHHCAFCRSTIQPCIPVHRSPTKSMFRTLLSSPLSVRPMIDFVFLTAATRNANVKSKNANYRLPWLRTPIIYVVIVPPVRLLLQEITLTVVLRCIGLWVTVSTSSSTKRPQCKGCHHSRHVEYGRSHRLSGCRRYCLSMTREGR